MIPVLALLSDHARETHFLFQPLPHGMFVPLVHPKNPRNTAPQLFGLYR